MNTQADRIVYLIASHPELQGELLQAVRPLMTDDQYRGLLYCVAYLTMKMHPERELAFRKILAEYFYKKMNERG